LTAGRSRTMFASEIMNEQLRTQIEGAIKKNKVVLFMKGNKHFPQCGFSAQVVQILKDIGTDFDAVNVLQDAALRDGIKEFSEWPTIPQLYVNGEFVGGCDIVKDLYSQGELQKIIGVKDESTAPTITVTAAAAKALIDAQEPGEDVLRIDVNAQFKYDLYFGPKKAGDFEIKSNGVSIFMDRASGKRAHGMSVDFVETKDGGAFKIENPNEPAGVKALRPVELKAWVDKGETFALFDVRTDAEIKTASVSFAKPLDDAGMKALAELDRNAKVVFMCHHGMRSRAAAERFLNEGYKNVYNLEGGIDAWSSEVDSSVPKY
jgi:monothiol glutaredoxin